jgi:hypothetical protein
MEILAMWLTSLLPVLDGRRGRSPQVRRRRAGRGKPGAARRFLPRLDCLEDRAVPSTVTSPLDDSTSGTLRAALAGTPAGGVIDFKLPAGQHTIKLTQGELLLTQNVTILAAGVVIDANHASRAFEVKAGAWATLDGLTVINGLGDNGKGGAISNAGNLLLTRCTLMNNEVIAPQLVGQSVFAEGGGVYNEGNLALLNCTLSSNAAFTDRAEDYAMGGGIFNKGFLWLGGCTLSRPRRGGPRRRCGRWRNGTRRRQRSPPAVTSATTGSFSAAAVSAMSKPSPRTAARAASTTASS